MDSSRTACRLKEIERESKFPEMRAEKIWCEKAEVQSLVVHRT